jgi:archaellum biogenesis ATPase FlaH
LPSLGVVTSTAISEIGNDCSLLVILDSLSSLIQKVGLRRSTEFFKVLVAKTRSIDANLLTSLNTLAFSERTLATYVDIADVVLELAINDDVGSTSKLRLRKARDVKHVNSWFLYEIDFDRHTLRFDIMKTI